MKNSATQEEELSADWEGHDARRLQCSGRTGAMTIDDWHLDRPTQTSRSIARSRFAKIATFKMMEFSKVSFDIGEPIF